MHGDDVNIGMARAEDVEDRMRVVREMAVRKAECLAGRAYRKAGSPDPRTTNRLTAYVSIAQAQSYAFTVRFGTAQMDMPFADQKDGVQAVIDSLIQGLEALERNDLASLKEMIPDDSYRRNFVSLAAQLRPDGHHVKEVGLTVMRGQKEEITALRTPPKLRTAEPTVPTPFQRRQPDIESANFTVTGTLWDGLKSNQQIRIRQDDGRMVSVLVREGLEDIVRNLFDRRVQASIRKDGKHLILDDILPERG